MKTISAKRLAKLIEKRFKDGGQTVYDSCFRSCVVSCGGCNKTKWVSMLESNGIESTLMVRLCTRVQARSVE